MSDTTRAFPIELLQASTKKRLDFYRNKLVSHMLLDRVLDEILEAILDPGDRLITLVCGAPGVGKSTLAKRLRRRLLQIALDDPEWDCGRIATVTSTLASYNNKPFSWRDFYIRLLKEMGEILLPYKMVFNEKGIFYGSSGEITVERAVNASTLAQVLEKVITHRLPLAFILDEGHHLLKLAHGENAREQMESFKTMVDSTRSPMVFIGIHKLLEFAQKSGQIDRRTRIFQFDRYNPRLEKHVEEYCTVLHNFFELMPLPEIPDLDNQWDFFMEKSFGEIGLLKDWLYDCLKHVLYHEEPCLTLKICERLAPSEVQLGCTLDDILDGEKDYAQIIGSNQEAKDILEKRNAIREALGLPELVDTANSPDGPSNSDDAGDDTSDEHSHQNAGQRKPGERSPKRDKVGLK